MIVLHIIGNISRSNGGPSRSSQGLVAGLRAAGVDAWLMTLSHGEEPWIKGCDRFIKGGAFEDALIKVKPAIVHLHGIWSLHLHRCAVICRRWRIPYVIAPRGMLEPWSLKQKWLKKRVARWLYQDRDLRKAAALHATAESEAEQFRKLGFKNYVIVSPNGVNVPVDAAHAPRQKVGQESRSTAVGEALSGCSSPNCTAKQNTTPSCAFRRNAPTQVGDESDAPSTSTLNFNSTKPYRALFVSRMHPKKGVLELVESWARVKPRNWVCELVYTLNGDTEREYEAKVKQRITELGMTYVDAASSPRMNVEQSPSLESKSKSGGHHSSTSTFNFNSAPDFILTGPLDDSAKWQAYARADLFILPTCSENFGIVVAEALWASVPVITTKGTPWSELVSHHCGWWIDLPGEESPSEELKSKSGVSNHLSTTPWPALDAALREATSGALGDRTLPDSTHHSSTSTLDFDSSPTSTLNFDSLRAMGANGHALVESKYTWPAVVKAMSHGYEQILTFRQN